MGAGTGRSESEEREAVRAQAWMDAERDMMEAEEEAEYEANRGEARPDFRPFAKVADVPTFDDHQRDLFRELAADARRARRAA